MALRDAAGGLVQAAREQPDPQDAERPGGRLRGLPEALEVLVALPLADSLRHASRCGKAQGGVELARGARVNGRDERGALDVGPLLGAGEVARAHQKDHGDDQVDDHDGKKCEEACLVGAPRLQRDVVDHDENHPRGERGEDREEEVAPQLGPEVETSDELLVLIGEHGGSSVALPGRQPSRRAQASSSETLPVKWYACIPATRAPAQLSSLSSTKRHSAGSRSKRSQSSR